MARTCRQVRAVPVVLTLAVLVACGAASPGLRTDLPGEAMVRTELYMGAARPGGGEVTDEEWKRFLDDSVTPLFADGLTVVAASGQWKNSGGDIIHERTRILVLVHPKSAEADGKVDRIVNAYRQRFQQESVMRLTAPTSASF